LIDSGRVKKGFMYGIDFSPSRAAIAVLGGEIVSMPVEVFSTVESMKNLREDDRDATDRAMSGIVEVEIRFKRWVEKPT
jgi:hypothetical protein